MHRTVGEAIGSLASMRRSVGEIGAGLLGSGTHPSGLEGDAEITDKERYERIRFLLGDAIVTPVAGMHVHVGMPDAETAIGAFNALREQLPLLQALAANSPFRHGRDTGLASAREISIRGWPRSGVPRALHDFDDFCELSALLATAADVADYTWFWWKLRPHPRLGTVEVRGMDAQGSLQDAGAIIALTHCLARDAAEHPAADAGAPPELIEEGMFRAARFGVDASLPDHDGHLRPVAELLARRAADRVPTRRRARLRGGAGGAPRAAGARRRRRAPAADARAGGHGRAGAGPGRADDRPRLSCTGGAGFTAAQSAARH